MVKNRRTRQRIRYHHFGRDDDQRGKQRYFSQSTGSLTSRWGGKSRKPPVDPGYGNRASYSGGQQCIICKGARRLCGKDRCPLMVKYYAKQRVAPMISSLDLDGSSPPGVFVGRYGYPKVNIGPLIPPVHGDTALLDTPEEWVGRSIDDIVSFRSQLVRGKLRVAVDDIEGRNCSDHFRARKIVDHTRELAMGTLPTDIEALFDKRPSGRLKLSAEVQPYGPSGPLSKIDVDNVKIDRRIEKATSDTDLLAKDAVLSLYDDGVLISKLQRAFSVGAFGVEKRRKFVPTRWSITAVDSTLGLEMTKETKDHLLINEYRVYTSASLDNRWVILMMPTSWRYELIEAWYPNTAWNPAGRKIFLISDHEFHDGRTEYARIGGCYYAARLAVNEALHRERRQAGTVIMREAHSGYIMPVGVWNVRENVRATLRETYRTFDTLANALQYAMSILDIPLGRWKRNSALLKDKLYQRTLDEFR